MTTQKKKRNRDIEKNYPVNQFVKKLWRLADCIEQGQEVSDPGGRGTSLHTCYCHHQYRT